MKELDLGNSDFKSIIENNNYFVDKSLFIKEVIKAQKQVILLPRPRRFGKTMNLSMLQSYFSIENPERKNLFTELAIWKAEEDIKEKYAKYPVLYLSFKDAKDDNWNDCLELIKDEIVELYNNHLYLLESNALAENEKNDFKDIINKTALTTTYKGSLKKLSKYLFKYYNQKVVILIDEYDTPIQAGYNKFYEEVVSFMRNLLSGAYKDNSYLYKGVITGILRVSKESIFSGLNNVSVYSIFDDEFSDKFGFTEKEVKQVVSDFNIVADYELIKKWYDGYQFGNTKDLYNPWSILNYVVEHQSGFKAFWVNTSSDALLKEQIKRKDGNYIREELQKLINNETIEKEIEENFVFPDLNTDSDLIWSLLAFSGYLTSKSKTGRRSYELAIPNYEVKTVFQDIILKWLKTDVNIKRATLIETAKHLTNNEIEKFEKGFKQIIGDTFSYFDVKGEPENVYQSYVLGLLAILGDDYIIRSNRESGDGRYDILLIPHDKSKYGVVIEIKQMAKDEKDDNESLRTKINNKIKEAKAQIEKNKYYMELIEHQISNIIQLPIVFVGKEPYVTER